jgi:solute carrier family 25 citrate transporter 1
MMSGVTEAVAVVTPMEVIKIRLQAQTNSMSDPSDWNKRKYRGTFHALFCIVKYVHSQQERLQ